MIVPIYVYITLPSEFINNNGLDIYKYYTNKINYVLNALYENDIYSQVNSISFIVKNKLQYDNICNNFKVKYTTNTNNYNFIELPHYFSKMNCLIRPDDSEDNTKIMSEIYYHVAKNVGCFFNILFFDFKKILQVNKLIEVEGLKHLVLNKWLDYLIYFYITNANECIGNLYTANVCGVDLIDSTEQNIKNVNNSPYPYYYSNCWWTNSNYIKTLTYLNYKCTPYITDGINGGLYASLWKSIDWFTIVINNLNYLKEYTSDDYTDKESNIYYVSVKNGYTDPPELFCFKPNIPEENKPKQEILNRNIFSLGSYKSSESTKKYVKPEITPCEYRDRLLRWNRPKPKTASSKPPVTVFQLGKPKY